jgi:hypothetical protein
LDALNAIDTLEAVVRAHVSPRLCSDAQVYDGKTPRPWVGVLMWHRPPGYLGYKVLTLVGLWAVEAQTGVEICLGTKRLPFARPFFDPEPYHRLIGRDFTLYYDDDGAPPSEPNCRIAFAPEERLAQRKAVAEALAALFK